MSLRDKIEHKWEDTEYGAQLTSKLQVNSVCSLSHGEDTSFVRDFLEKRSAEAIMEEVYGKALGQVYELYQRGFMMTYAEDELFLEALLNLRKVMQ